MKTIRYILLIISGFIFVLPALYAAHGGAAPKEAPKAEAGGEGDTSQGSEAAPEGGGIRLGGDFGKGTDPVMFDDESLVSTPVPTMTPDIKLEKQEIQAWKDIRNTRDLLMRCRTDLVRYEKFMRKEFMANLNDMQKSIASVHTYALLYKRAEVDFIWGNAAAKAEATLATCEEFAYEFGENYDDMVKNQKSVMTLLAKSASKIQQPEQIRREWETNREQMFWTKKKIDYFSGLYMDYVAKYNKTLDDREARVEKLLLEHRELHKP